MPHYHFINVTEVDNYYDQLVPEKSVKETKETEFTFNIPSVLTIKKKRSIQKEKKELKSPAKLSLVLENHPDFEIMATNRPRNVMDYESSSEFLYEELEATKFVFPKEMLDSIGGLNHLAVWVSDPNYDDLSKEDWNISGSYLYLIEVGYKIDPIDACHSGRSALQLISNMVNNRPLLALDMDQKCGMGSYDHPSKKLEDIGAKYFYKSKIKSVYKRIYMSNEQYAPYNNLNYRCNDLLGYPLYIAAYR